MIGIYLNETLTAERDGGVGANQIRLPRTSSTIRCRVEDSDRQDEGIVNARGEFIQFDKIIITAPGALAVDDFVTIEGRERRVQRIALGKDFGAKIQRSYTD